MLAVDHLPPELKQTFGFKLAVYILPGIIFALVTALVLIPAPKPKHGLVQGHVMARSVASTTLIVSPTKGSATSTEITLIADSDYKIDVPAGEYLLALKDNARSPQLPRTLTISPNSSMILDITIE